MECIKKKIKLIQKKIPIDNGYSLVVNEDKKYSLMIMLTSTFIPLMNFKSDVELEDLVDLTVDRVITGESSSRLSELKKFIVNDNLERSYKTSTTIYTNGVDLVNSNNDKIVYYINFIKYVDDLTNKKTTFEYNLRDFKNKIDRSNAIYDGNDSSLGRASVKSEVFIERQKLSVFEKIYRLEEVSSIDDIENYGGGTQFKIIENF